MVHEETLREIVEGGTGLMGTLLKELVVHRNQMTQMERKKELELDLAKARRESTSEEAQPTDAVEAAPSTGAGVDLSAAFEDLKARETCETCRDLLEAIETAPHDVQVTALTEWGRFKHAVETGASEAEIRNVLESSDTLVDLLEEQVAG